MVYIHGGKKKVWYIYIHILQNSYYDGFSFILFSFLSSHPILEQVSHWPSGSISWYSFSIGSVSRFFLASDFSFGCHSHTVFSRRLIGQRDYSVLIRRMVFYPPFVFFSLWPRASSVNFSTISAAAGYKCYLLFSSDPIPHSRHSLYCFCC